MNIEQLRQSLKVKWLSYYQENRPWLTRLGVWVNCDGQRRPSSSFILATLSILEPKLTQLFPLIVELSNHPDRVVAALGLNFNPDAELKLLEADSQPAIANPSVKMLPAGAAKANSSHPARPNPTPAVVDETCRGVRPARE